jgi:hypothetical protein
VSDVRRRVCVIDRRSDEKGLWHPVKLTDESLYGKRLGCPIAPKRALTSQSEALHVDCAGPQRLYETRTLFQTPLSSFQL